MTSTHYDLDPEVIDFLSDIKMSPNAVLRHVMSFVKSLSTQFSEKEGLPIHQISELIRGSILNADFSSMVSKSLFDNLQKSSDDGRAALVSDIVSKIGSSVSTNQAGIIRDLGGVQSVIDILKKDHVASSKVIEKIVQLCESTQADLQRHLQRYNSKGGSVLKGQTAERDLFLQLQKHFIDYEITNVSGIGGQMDFMLQHKDGLNIGIECKADDYGNVSNNEVKRFIQNVTDTGRHGIMVSLYNGISGYKNMDLMITHNNRIAMFLTENRFNLQDIEECVRIISNLNGFIDKLPVEDQSGIKLSTSKIESIRRMVSFWDNEIKELKKHLKFATDQVNHLKVSSLLELILADAEGSDDKFSCPFRCKKMFNIQDSEGLVKGKGLGGLRKHLDSCACKSDTFYCSLCKSNFEKYDVTKFMNHIKTSHQK